MAASYLALFVRISGGQKAFLPVGQLFGSKSGMDGGYCNCMTTVTFAETETEPV